MIVPDSYNDPDSPRNGPEWHTGKPCIDTDCDQPAGTAWSPLWCFACNVKRIDRVTAGLNAIRAIARRDS